MAALKTTPIVALDVPTADDALRLVDLLDDRARFYKVGNELFTGVGPSIVSRLRERGCDVFLDLKLHDIPNTVAGAVRRAVAMGVRLVTVHATGGRAMLRAAVDAAGDQSHCGILAVSVLTSLTAAEIAEAWGRESDLVVTDEVLRLARAAAETGAHGLVCSGLEAALVNETTGGRLAVLVPGVRFAGTGAQDQARVVTPAAAAAAGARYIVLGRAVSSASDPRSAMDRVIDELS